MSKILAVFFIFGFLSIFSGVASFADENPAPANNDELVLDKLDKIMESQSQVLKQLEDMKSELQIVKIRASQR